MFTALFIVATVTIYGLIRPKSIPGTILWTGLSQIGFVTKNYKAKHALENFDAAVDRKKAGLAPKAETAANIQAQIDSIARQRDARRADLYQAERKISVLDSRGVDNSNAQKLNLASQAIGLKRQIAEYDVTINDLAQALIEVKGHVVKQLAEVAKDQQDVAVLKVKLETSAIRNEVAKDRLSIGDSHDTTAEAKEAVLRQIDQNNAKANVFTEVFGQDDALDVEVVDQEALQYLNNRTTVSLTHKED